jgi:hypothetical protein
MDIWSAFYPSKNTTARRFEAARADYAALVVLALKNLARDGYQLSKNEQALVNLESSDFKKVKTGTWQAIPASEKLQIDAARHERELWRTRLQSYAA